MKKRIWVGAFKQESNSFCPNLMGLEAFEKNLLEGEKIVEEPARVGQTVTGAVETLKRQGCELIGGIAMRSISGGALDQRVVDFFLKNALQSLRCAGKLDGVFLDLHGATISALSDDVCGDILSVVRETVGENVTVAVTYDLHANVTEQTWRNADIVCGYQTYPHVDYKETGCRAAELLLQKISGEPMRMAHVSIPMIAPAHAYTTNEGALKELMSRGHAMVEHGKIWDFSIFQAQPWLDIPRVASSVTVIARDEEAAKEAVLTLAMGEFSLRKALQGKPLHTMEQVVLEALNNRKGKPVVLVDAADSAGAGSSGDSAAPLNAILPYRDKLRAAITVADPVAVKRAFSLGVGATADFVLGATLAPKMSKPVVVHNALVKSLHSGRYIAQGPIEQGQPYDIGKCAVLEVGKITILVMTSGQTERDIQIFRGFGIEPAVCQLLCIKACNSFKASYASAIGEAFPTATPGSANPVLQDLPYERMKMPVYPFCEIKTEDIGRPVGYR